MSSLGCRIDALYATLRDPRCPWLARILIFGLGCYLFSPIDLIPDFIPVIGLLDDALLLPLGLWFALKLVPRGVYEEHLLRAESGERCLRPRALIAITVTIWLALTLIIIALLWRMS